MNELVIPPPAERDENAVEMIRAWIAEKSLHCSINVGMWRESEQVDEAQAWGILLADVVKHVSNAMNERYGDDPKETTRQLVQSFARELKIPTSEADGYFWQH